MAVRSVRTTRGFDRLVNYTDAVVAIAITLLVLPLVDLGSQAEQVPALELVTTHYLQFGAFLMTFLVMTIFWVTHHALFELVAGYDTGLLWLNSMWLLGIVLFPFTSELINSGGFGDGAGFLYCATMAALSLVQGLISVHTRSRPALWAPGVTREDFHPGWAWVFTSYFLLVAALSLPFPGAASWAMLGLIVIGRVRGRMQRS